MYDKVVVIDAGHGGRAPGANKQGVNEKEIDLDIVLQLKKILDHSLRPVGMILLVIASGGVIRWMLQDSGLGEIIGPALEKSGMPLILVAFLIALLVRASVGSSMVAMTMASGIMATMRRLWQQAYYTGLQCAVQYAEVLQH